ncbi:MAG: hypothetical protein WCP97_02995 [bacterium]
MRIVLLANTVFEAGVGFVMIFIPTLFLNSTNELVFAVGRSLGFASASIAVLSFSMLLKKPNKTFLSMGFTTLTVFHVGLTVSQLINFVEWLSPLYMVIIHAVFAGASAVYLVKSLRN